MTQKTPPELTVTTTVADPDLFVTWSGAGPLKAITAANLFASTAAGAKADIDFGNVAVGAATPGNITVGGALTVSTSIGYKFTTSPASMFGDANNIGWLFGGSGRVFMSATTGTFTVAPDGANVRMQISDTSGQLPYDCIVLAKEGNAQPPNISWKMRDDGTNGGSDIPLFGITCTFGSVALQADHKEDMAFYTDDNTGTVHTASSIQRAYFTGGVATSCLTMVNNTSLGFNGVVPATGQAINTNGLNIVLANSTGAQSLYVYYGTATNNAGIGTDTAGDGGVRVFSGTAAPADRLFVDSSGNVIVGPSKTSNGAGLLQVDGNIVPFTNISYSLGTTSFRYTAVWATDAEITTSVKIGGTKVVGAQGAAVADAVAAVGAPTQAEFNALVTQFNLLLARVRASTGHGLIA